MAFTFYEKTSLRSAIQDWFSDATATQLEYGPMNRWNVSFITDMSRMFACDDSSYPSLSCTKFNEDISSWDVSRVTNMGGMFSGVSSFNQDLSKWDVSRVTNMVEMFDSAISFNQALFTWDVSRVTNMYRMFYQASSFNQNISNWNVARVTNMSYMFYEASSFNQNLSPWDTAQVTDMSWMFGYAVSFNQKLCWKFKVTSESSNYWSEKRKVRGHMFDGTMGGSTGLCAHEIGKIVAIVVCGTAPVLGIMIYIVLLKKNETRFMSQVNMIR